MLVTAAAAATAATNPDTAASTTTDADAAAAAAVLSNADKQVLYSRLVNLENTISGEINKKIKIKKNEIYEWFFMHYINNKSLIKNNDSILNPLLYSDFGNFNFLNRHCDKKYKNIFNKIIL
jgi:hypothetical protein